jgi:hypothetical protein
MRAAMKATHGLKVFCVLLFAAGCVDEEADVVPPEVGDEVDESQIDNEEPVESIFDSTTEEVIADLEDPELALDGDDNAIVGDTIGPAYHLFTKTGATCRDRCIAHDEYIGSYGVVFSSPFYHYNSSKVYADYYVGASRKQKWEQHRFKRAHVDLYCGSSGQYLRKYYGRAKRGREVVRTYICYAGRCRFQGDNVGSFYRGWKH